MKNYRVESALIPKRFEEVFSYVANPQKLPEWTHAFKAVQQGKAILETPAGAVEVVLKVDSFPSAGTIDWHMTMPDGTSASAFSRVIRESDRHTIFVFVLMAPPVPLEVLEGTLDQQATILRAELAKLKHILSGAPFHQ